MCAIMLLSAMTILQVNSCADNSKAATVILHSVSDTDMIYGTDNAA